MWKAALLTLVLLPLASCSAFQVKAEVESNTSWSGSFDGRTVSGTGNQTVDMGRKSNMAKCAVVQKQTREGVLTVKISGGESRTTFAEFGVVTACSD